MAWPLAPAGQTTSAQDSTSGSRCSSSARNTAFCTTPLDQSTASRSSVVSATVTPTRKPKCPDSGVSPLELYTDAGRGAHCAAIGDADGDADGELAGGRALVVEAEGRAAAEGGDAAGEALFALLQRQRRDVHRHPHRHAGVGGGDVVVEADHPRLHLAEAGGDGVQLGHV